MSIRYTKLGVGLLLLFAAAPYGAVFATDPPNSTYPIVKLTSAIAITSREAHIETIALNDAPASVTNPGEILPLATGGPYVFAPLPATGSCSPRPVLSCLGPDYCECNPYIYFGTNPCDDDPVLSMSPEVCDTKTTHWYSKALNMILRKKAITEAIKH